MRVTDCCLRIKIFGGFFTVTMLVIATALVGYRGMTNVTQVFTAINASMEMKLAVRSNLQMVMEMLAAEGLQDLEKSYRELQNNSRQFHLFNEALQKGEKPRKEPFIVPTTNRSSRP